MEDPDQFLPYEDEGALARQLVDFRPTGKPGSVERIYSRKRVEQAFLEVFELIGGVPRLALWANQEENYGEYLKLFAKLMPKTDTKEVATLLEYHSRVPQSALNRREPEKAPADASAD